MVGELDGTQPHRRGRTVAYARVSSADEKSDLDRQVARVTAWATANGHTVDQVVTEVGPARNGRAASSWHCSPTRR
jgi:predicted site-specific integrase-resolvase